MTVISGKALETGRRSIQNQFQMTRQPGGRLCCRDSDSKPGIHGEQDRDEFHQPHPLGQPDLHSGLAHCIRQRRVEFDDDRSPLLRPSPSLASKNDANLHRLGDGVGQSLWDRSREPEGPKGGGLRPPPFLMHISITMIR